MIKFLLLLLISSPLFAGECDQTGIDASTYVVPVYCTTQKVLTTVKPDGTTVSRPVRNTLVHADNDCEIKDYLAFCSGSAEVPPTGISEDRIVPGLEVKCGSSPCNIAQVSGKLFTVINGFEVGFDQSSKVYHSNGKLLGVIRKKLKNGVGYAQRIYK